MQTRRRTIAPLRDPPVGLAAGGAFACVVLVIFLISARVELRDAQSRADDRSHRIRSELALEAQDVAAKPPGLDALSNKLRLLDELSREHDLDLSQQSAQLARDKAGGYRYTIRLPLTAPYPAIRAFVDEALSEIPNLALGNLNFERGDIQDTVVNADVQLVFFFSS